jgi:hypothetical protein
VRQPLRYRVPYDDHIAVDVVKRGTIIRERSSRAQGTERLYAVMSCTCFLVPIVHCAAPPSVTVANCLQFAEMHQRVWTSTEVK